MLRIGGRDTELLGIDRRAEDEASLAAAAVGVGPEVIAFLEPEGYLVTRFLEGEVVAGGDDARARDVRRVAPRCAPSTRAAVPGRFDAFRVVEAYARPRRARVRYRRLTSGAREVARAMSAPAGRCPSGLPQRPPHRELHRRRHADPDRRLGVRRHGRHLLRPGELLRQSRPRRRRRAELLPPTSARCARPRRALELMRFMSVFREAMWGVVQRALSDLDFDFAATRRSISSAPPAPRRAGLRKRARGRAVGPKSANAIKYAVRRGGRISRMSATTDTFARFVDVLADTLDDHDAAGRRSRRACTSRDSTSTGSSRPPREPPAGFVAASCSSAPRTA